MFFKIYFVLNRRKKLTQVWNNLKASKLWQIIFKSIYYFKHLAQCHPKHGYLKPFWSQPRCLVNEQQLLFKPESFISLRGLSGIWMDCALLLWPCYFEVKHSIQPVWEMSSVGSQPNRFFSIPSGLSLWCRHSCVTSVWWILKSICWYAVKSSRGTWHLDLSQSSAIIELQ